MIEYLNLASWWSWPPPPPPTRMHAYSHFLGKGGGDFGSSLGKIFRATYNNRPLWSKERRGNRPKKSPGRTKPFQSALKTMQNARQLTSKNYTQKQTNKSSHQNYCLFSTLLQSFLGLIPGWGTPAPPAPIGLEMECFCNCQWLPIPEIGGISFFRDIAGSGDGELGTLVLWGGGGERD